MGDVDLGKGRKMERSRGGGLRNS